MTALETLKIGVIERMDMAEEFRETLLQIVSCYEVALHLFLQLTTDFEEVYLKNNPNGGT